MEVSPCDVPRLPEPGDDITLFDQHLFLHHILLVAAYMLKKLS
jgi:hypothetical protein